MNHRVHGTDGREVAADWPALTRAEIAALLRSFRQLGELRRILWHSPRPLSAASLIETTEGRLFVKRHHARVRSVATLAEEHDFIAHLREASAPVPQVLANIDGQRAIARGDWVFEVHAQAAGIDLYRNLESWQPLRNLRHAREAGRALAQLHRAAAGFDAPQRRTHILVSRNELLLADDPVATLDAQLGHRPGLAAYLQSIDWRADLERSIAPRQHAVQARTAAEPRLWTHNDWHASNLTWSGSGDDATVASVFDFGLGSPTFALFDLATAIERNAIDWLQLPRHNDIGHPDIAKALIAGYRDITPLDAADLSLVADLLPVIHIDFAVSEVEYFHAITGCKRNADIAWHDFLLGHANWFDRQSAHALQQTITKP